MQARVHQQGDTTIFESVQDCSPILENAQALHKAGFHGSNETKHAARIPLVVVEAYCNKLGILFSEFIGDQAHRKAILNDPDLSGFRIWKGQV
jgi:hypothetical protein